MRRNAIATADVALNSAAVAREDAHSHPHRRRPHVHAAVRTLKDARIGERVRVTRLRGEGALRRRIMDMGLTRGTEIYVHKVAPLGDPIQVTVRGYELTLRKADADLIEIDK